MTSILWALCTIVVFMINFVVSPPPAYIGSTRPTVRLSDQEFEHIIKDEQEKPQKNQPPPDEKTMVRIFFQVSFIIKTEKKNKVFVLILPVLIVKYFI